MGVYFLSDRHWPSFIGELSRTHRIYYPVEQGEDYQLTRAGEGSCPAIPFNRYRMVQPFKSLLFEPRLRAGGYLGGGGEARPPRLSESDGGQADPKSQKEQGSGAVPA